MHIAIVSPEFPPDIGGVETYAREFVTELARRGHDVTVFTVRHPQGEVALPGVRIEPVLKTLPERRQTGTCRRPGGRMARAQRGVRVDR